MWNSSLETIFGVHYWKKTKLPRPRILIISLLQKTNSAQNPHLFPHLVKYYIFLQISLLKTSKEFSFFCKQFHYECSCCTWTHNHHHHNKLPYAPSWCHVKKTFVLILLGLLLHRLCQDAAEIMFIHPHFLFGPSGDHAFATFFMKNEFVTL